MDINLGEKAMENLVNEMAKCCRATKGGKFGTSSKQIKDLYSRRCFRYGQKNPCCGHTKGTMDGRMESHHDWAKLPR